MNTKKILSFFRIDRRIHLPFGLIDLQFEPKSFTEDVRLIRKVIDMSIVEADIQVAKDLLDKLKEEWNLKHSDPTVQALSSVMKMNQRRMRAANSPLRNI